MKHDEHSRALPYMPVLHVSAAPDSHAHAHDMTSRCDQRGVALDDVVRESGIFRLKMTNKSMQECICLVVSHVVMEVSRVVIEDTPPQDDPQKHAGMSCLCTWVSGLRLSGRSASE